MLEDIRHRLNDSEHVYFCASEEETRYMFSLIDKYKDALNECKAYDIKANCNFCGGGITEIVNSALDKE